jgi:prepilin-type N-terminal cleavage/methylation domain-containing protein
MRELPSHHPMLVSPASPPLTLPQPASTVPSLTPEIRPGDSVVTSRILSNLRSPAQRPVEWLLRESDLTEVSQVRRFIPAREDGFTFIELLVVMAAIVTISAVLVPNSRNLLNTMKARNAARVVERQLQTARLKAVTNSRALRVRFDCPVAGQMRILEVTGVTATDQAGNRCDQTAYPYPGPNDALRSTPSMDSPVVYLPAGTTVTCAGCPAGTTAPIILEFGPRGTVVAVTPQGAASSFTGDVTITVGLVGQTNEVRVNELGRVKFN